MITLYTKDHCPFCSQAKALLEQNDIPYEEVNIIKDTTAKQFVIGEGHRTVPQLYVKGKLLVEGGYQGLSKLPLETVKQRIEELNAN
jgi:glutaredoxin